MFQTIFKKIFGSRNQRLIKKMKKTVIKINHLEAELTKLDDTALKAKTDAFRQRYQQGSSLDELLIETFAVVREVSKRTLGLRHFDVQLIGGMVLHQGKIDEMRTGEGKTLMATLAAYLNAIAGEGVHIVTVNDYLAQRDAEWMRPIYEFLGLTVGVNLPNMSAEDKREAYAADITYGTNNEFGFDYLRDNMAFSLADKVQRTLNFAIVDEVDSILIDEARTPLIISGPSDDSSDMYIKINGIIPQLTKREEEDGDGDYYLEEKNRQAFLTESGHARVEELLRKIGLLSEHGSLYDSEHVTLNHYLNASLRAHTLYHRDVEYIVKDGEIVIVDEHTGRTMPGRRWSEGLHQAVEAKEGVPIKQENQTLASITFQNYFRLYQKLSGMTGTADTEAFEFQQIYGLEVVVIPTNKPMIRKDHPDKIYLTMKGKFDAVIEDIKACRERGQPVLVGTAAIETSEYLSALLKKEKIDHQVLNAKFHQKEAKIIAEAGRPGAITIATNMAGRGTDIVLGGNLESEIAALGKTPDPAKVEAIKTAWQARHQQVLDAGGLAVVCSERHESRRIDNQLRGRSGRQGDPGSSRFYLSLEDNLMRIFASPRVAGLMQKLGMKENEAIEHSWLNKAIENAQRKVEGHNFDIRKQLLEYDDIANEQRQVIYQQRNNLLAEESIADDVKDTRAEVVGGLVNSYIPSGSIEEQWDVKGLQDNLTNEFGLPINLVERVHADKSLNHEDIEQLIRTELETIYAEKETKVGETGMRQFEKAIALQTVDSHWRDHLSAMDHLRQGIHFRGYAQKNPKQEYKREAYQLFIAMLEEIKYEMIKLLSIVQIQQQQDVDAMENQRRAATPLNVTYEHAEFAEQAAVAEPDEANAPEKPQTFRRDMPKVGRNDPCPCGSGKKYKQCHGKV
ncbi:MAG: preprotein translocase subunit SecA [Pseudomonadota bacterium]